MLLFLLGCVHPSADRVDVGGADTAGDTVDTAAGDTDSADETAQHTGETAHSGESGDSDSDAETGDTASPTWRSALYPEDWTPAYTDPDGWFLQDFSYAGYRASEVPIPTVKGPVFAPEGLDRSGAADSTVAIQAALDAAAAAGGGVVELGEGELRIDGLLSVQSSGVVLRGAGPASTHLRFTRATDMAYRSHLSFTGTLQEGPDLPLAADGGARDTELLVADPGDLAPGDEVHVGWVITDEFVEAHGMTGTWVSFNGQWRPFFRRTVVSVDRSVSPARVELDVPLRYPALLRDGASLREVNGYLREVGVEDLAFTNVMTWDEAWAASQVHVLELAGVRDAWVRNVQSYAPSDPPDTEGDHLASGGLLVRDSRRVTVADTTLEEAQNRGDGGNGYLYEIRTSNEVLTVDSVARAGRHNFIQNWDFGTSGCVWLRTTSEDSRALLGDWDPVGLPAYSEFHHSLAMANLVDQSVATDGWQGVNRHDESSGAGHSLTESVFWNTSGGGYLRSLQYGRGYIVAPNDMDVHSDPEEWSWDDAGEGTEPADWVEGLGEARPIEPASLFEDQLARRLGG